MEIFTLELGCCATNTYIIIEKDNAIVVDPADNADVIAEFVANKNASMRHVLITHGHFDHIKAARELQKLGANVYMNKTDYDVVAFGKPNDVFGAPSDRFTLDVAVSDGFEFDLFGHTFKAIFTPGHTAGGVCYVLDDEIIFSGDTLFKLGIGRTDFEYGDFATLIASIKKLFELPHDYRVLPGHGGETSLYFEKQYNPYVHC